MPWPVTIGPKVISGWQLMVWPDENTMPLFRNRRWHGKLSMREFFALTSFIAVTCAAIAACRFEFTASVLLAAVGFFGTMQLLVRDWRMTLATGCAVSVSFVSLAGDHIHGPLVFLVVPLLINDPQLLVPHLSMLLTGRSLVCQDDRRQEHTPHAMVTKARTDMGITGGTENRRVVD